MSFRAEPSSFSDPRLAVVIGMIENGLAKIFPLGDPPDYEPAPETSVAAEAARTGRDPFDVLYDHMLRDEGRKSADAFLAEHGDDLGKRSTLPIERLLEET